MAGEAVCLLKYTIEEHSPLQGGAGTAVILTLDQSPDEDFDSLTAWFGDTELTIAERIDQYIQVLIPQDIATGTQVAIRLGLDDARSNDAAFNVVALQKELLFEEALVVGEAHNLTFEVDSGTITLKIPEDVLTQSRTLTISRVFNIANNPLLPFETNAIDIAIDDLHELPGSIEIGLTYDPSVLDDDFPAEDQMAFFKWDEEQEIWLPLPFRVDTAAEMVYIETDHLCVVLGGSVLGVAGLLGKIVIPPPLLPLNSTSGFAIPVTAHRRATLRSSITAMRWMLS